MTDTRIHQVEMLYLLWVIPLMLGWFLYAGSRRRASLERFAEAGLLRLINVALSPARRRWKASLALLAFGFVVLGLARPAWNPKAQTIQRTGRDVVFVIDVSRSMLAEDLKPNRLERAKLSVMDCIERLEGDRVALVAFAGAAAVKCPLTLDYGFFRAMLEDISPDSIARGGTAIGDAIRKAVNEVFDDREKRFKDIILITDGEDHDSFPVHAAEEAGKRGIRLIAIGIGDEGQGQRVPVEDESGRRSFLVHQGKEVWSRLDTDTLRKMVNATPGGKYLNVATGAVDLGDVYASLVAGAEKRALEARTVQRYEEKFQVFLGVAFVLLCLDMALGERRRAA